MKYVVDASIVATAFLGKKSEPITKKATRFLSNDSLFSIPLLDFEVLNAIVYSKSSEDVQEALVETYFLLPLTKLEIDSHLLKTAHKLAVSAQDTLYDAAYHAISLSRDYTFVTLDQKYYRKAKKFGNIELLTKY